MKKEARINIVGTQIVDGVEDSVELMTEGVFYEKNGSFYISYEEPDENGYKNCKTTLKITGDEKAVMTRSGEYESHLFIEKNRRNVCQYNTLYGNMLLGISSVEIENNLDSSGGDATIRYSIDINTALLSENELKIHVM